MLSLKKYINWIAAILIFAITYYQFIVLRYNIYICSGVAILIVIIFFSLFSNHKIDSHLKSIKLQRIKNAIYLILILFFFSSLLVLFYLNSNFIERLYVYSFFYGSALSALALYQSEDGGEFICKTIIAIFIAFNPSAYSFSDFLSIILFLFIILRYGNVFNSRLNLNYLIFFLLLTFAILAFIPLIIPAIIYFIYLNKSSIHKLAFNLSAITAFIIIYFCFFESPVTFSFITFKVTFVAILTLIIVFYISWGLSAQNEVLFFSGIVCSLIFIMINEYAFLITASIFLFASISRYEVKKFLGRVYIFTNERNND